MTLMFVNSDWFVMLVVDVWKTKTYQSSNSANFLSNEMKNLKIPYLTRRFKKSIAGFVFGFLIVLYDAFYQIWRGCLERND